MHANNDPLGVSDLLTRSAGQIGREGHLESASRQTGFLHLAASRFWALLLKAVER